MVEGEGEGGGGGGDRSKSVGTSSPPSSLPLLTTGAGSAI